MISISIVFVKKTCFSICENVPQSVKTVGKFTVLRELLLLLFWLLKGKLAMWNTDSVLYKCEELTRNDTEHYFTPPIKLSYM